MKPLMLNVGAMRPRPVPEASDSIQQLRQLATVRHRLILALIVSIVLIAMPLLFLASTIYSLPGVFIGIIAVWHARRAVQSQIRDLETNPGTLALPLQENSLYRDFTGMLNRGWILTFSLCGGVLLASSLYFSNPHSGGVIFYRGRKVVRYQESGSLKSPFERVALIPTFSNQHMLYGAQGKTVHIRWSARMDPNKASALASHGVAPKHYEEYQQYVEDAIAKYLLIKGIQSESQDSLLLFLNQGLEMNNTGWTIPFLSITSQ